MNQDYIDNFEKPIDIYSTTSLQSARLINNTFSNVMAASYWYNSDLLNTSSSVIWSALNNTEYILSSSTSSDTATTDPSASTAQDAPQTDANGNTIITLLNPDDFTDGTSTASATSSSSNSTPATLQKQKRQQPTPTSGTATLTGSGATSTATPTAAAGVYLIAVLANVNATFSQNNNTSTNPPNQNTGGTGSTGLAMIILYAITGCV